MVSETIDTILRRASSRRKTIAFPDSTDERTIKAASLLSGRRIVKPLLVGSPTEIEKTAAAADVSLNGIELLDPSGFSGLGEFVDELFALREAKGMSRENAESTLLDPLFFSAMMTRRGLVDGTVSGSIRTTGDVLRAGIQVVGLAKGSSLVSSFFLIIFPERTYSFADCAVVPDPSADQLADIAITTAENHRKLTEEEPRIAFLSYSTKGSAEHPKVEKVVKAVGLAKMRRPDLLIDGEFQLDAAIDRNAASIKAPGSPVAGTANVLIFPDLDSGNIGYKMAQRMGGADAIGPLVQGLNRPVFDLSRGCSIDDIVSVAAVNAIIGNGE